MAIDTQARRRSAIATRRLPWMRRFSAGITPDSSVDEVDRTQLAFVYNGIDVGQVISALHRVVAVQAYAAHAATSQAHMPRGVAGDFHAGHAVTGQGGPKT